MATIDMQTMRYINLLRRIANVNTMKCFIYNNMIIFAVPANLVSKAVGPAGRNVRIIQERLGKKVKVIRDADNIEEAGRFVGDIVSPVNFVSLEVRDNYVILTAGIRNKAALIGRNKKRLEELRQIIEDNFGKELKIV